MKKKTIRYSLIMLIFLISAFSCDSCEDDIDWNKLPAETHEGNNNIGWIALNEGGNVNRQQYFHNRAGTINVGGFLKGKAEITGMLDLNKNVLYFEPQRFTLNGTTISGLNSSLLEPIAIYDFNEFPISVKADSISVKDEAIRIKVTPIIE